MTKRITAICMVIMLLLAGCNNGTTDVNSTNSEGETPEQAVENVFNAVKSADRETANKYFDYDGLYKSLDAEGKEVELDPEDQKSAEEQSKKVLSEMEYKIISSEETEDEDTATVKTEITNIDMGKVMKDLVGNVMIMSMQEANKEESDRLSDEETAKVKKVMEMPVPQLQEILASVFKKTDEMFDETLEKYKDEKVTNTVDIKLNKVSGQWKVVVDDDVKNAVMGGLMKATQEMIDSFKPQNNSTEAPK